VSAAEAISLPKGGGALSGIGETFQPDLQTGTGNLTVPIELPPGRNGLAPALSLAYSTGNGNSAFGLGWTLSVPQISRRTSSGVPTYGAHDVFVLSGSEDLVEVPLGSAASEQPEPGTVRRRYRPRTEAGFARIVHVTGAAGDYWEIRSGDGLISRYGTPKPAGATGWEDPAAIAAGEERGIFSWLLSRTEDTFGNRIEYFWSTAGRLPAAWADPLGGPQRYLSEIRYVDTGDPADPHFLVSVRIGYAERPDPFSDRRGGFDLRTTRRATSIETWMQHGEPVRTRRVELTYADQLGRPAATGVSLLAGVRVTGYDGTATQSLPPLEFGYTRWEPSTRRFRPLTGDLPEAGVSGSDRAGPRRADLDLVDLFGDGLPSFLQLDGRAGRYWRNRGSGHFDAPRSLSYAPAGGALSGPGIALADLDGDGRPEIVQAAAGTTTSWPLVPANGRAGFDPRARVTGAPTTGLSDPQARLTDLDGDGRMDLLWSGSALRAAFNDGRGGFTGLRPVRGDSGLPPLDFTDPRVHLADMTGDGLTDLVLIRRGAVSYWPALGHGRFGPEVVMTASLEFGDAGAFPATGFDPRRLLLGDVVGDGTADLVYVGDGYVSVWLNQGGNTFADTPAVLHGTPDVTGSVQLVDLDGTGVAGVLWSAAGSRRVRHAFLDLTGGVKPFLLDRIDNHSGAVSEIHYATSTAYAAADAAAGRPWRTTLPFPVHVVASTTARDWFSGTALTTGYEYHDGYWDPADREFRGFGLVEHLDTLTPLRPVPPAPPVLRPLDPLTPRSALPDGFDAAAQGNLLANWSFDVAAGAGPASLTTPPGQPLGTGPSAAAAWSISHAAAGTTATELLASTLPQGNRGRMLHVTTSAGRCGITQSLAPDRPGPARVVASAWLYVVRGSVSVGTGKTADATCTRTGAWVLVQAGNTETPAQSFTVTAASADGAEFYLDHAWLRVEDHPATPVDGPPMRTRTWFHLGAVGPARGNWTELDRRGDYWGEDPPLREHVDRTGLTALPRPVLREALRAVRGRVLRTESYAEDGSAAADRPYQVQDAAFEVVPVWDGRTAGDASWEAAPVMTVHEVFSRTAVWDRGGDPKISVTATGGFDGYGRPAAVLNLGVPRGRNPREAGEPCLATVTTTRYATRDDARYRIDAVARTARRQAVDPGDGPVADFAGRALTGAADGDLLALELRYYDGPAFTGLELGKLGDHGLPVRTEQLVLPPERLAEACRPAAPGGPGMSVPPYLALDGAAPSPSGWPAEYPDEFRSAVLAAPPSRGSQLGYVWHAAGDDHTAGYYARTSRLSYDVHTPAPGRALRGLPLVSRDAYGGDTATTYDPHDLLPASVTDPAGLATSAVYDYRVLQPAEITDPNGNRARAGYSPLGLPAWQARLGKAGEAVGDTVEQPSLRYYYALTAFDDSAGGPHRQPRSVRTLSRVDHRWTLVERENARRSEAGQPPLSEAEIAVMFGPDEPTAHPERFVVSVQYSDGSGRLLQTRTQADELTVSDVGLSDQPGQANRTVTADASDADRVVVSGWQVYDNKGRPVVTYEPFHATGFGYQAPDGPALAGLAATAQHYDPAGRVVRTVGPDGSETRTVWGVPADLTLPSQVQPTPWESYLYGPNDNAGRTHPTETLPLAGHWNTPESAVLDALGRTVTTTKRGGGEPLTVVRTYDLDGRVTSVTDVLGRPGASTVYDLTGNPWRAWLLDSGASHTVLDVTGAVVEARDDKGAVTLAAFDAAHRPTRGWAADRHGAPPTLRMVTVYGDSADSGLAPAQARAANAVGRAVVAYDEAGRLSTTGYDIAGRPTVISRRVLRTDVLLSLLPTTPSGTWEDTGYPVDWRPPPGQTLAGYAETLLDTTAHSIEERFDALGRRTEALAPLDVTGARAKLAYSYGRGGGVTGIALDGTPYLRRAVYDAYGRRVLSELGNGVLLRARYDRQTARLRRLRAERATGPAAGTWVGDGPVLQECTYRYDPSGNLLGQADRSPDCGLPLGDRHALDRLFGYDPLDRLVSATGRETDTAPAQPWVDVPRSTDVTKARGYVEEYSYDALGTLRELRHRTDTQGTGAYTRTFSVPEGNNRLASLTTAGLTVPFGYDPCGNPTSEAGNRHFEWDHRNRLSTFRDQAGPAGPTVYGQYRYGPTERVLKLVRRGNGPPTVTLYLGGFERVLVPAAGGGPATAYDAVALLDGPVRLARVPRGGALPDDALGAVVTYSLGDRLGSVTLTLDAAGTPLSREEYLPYGGTSFGSHARKRYRFTGKERDEESGLYHCVARYYSPWLCRWMGCDPVPPDGSESPYVYVRGRPLTLVDPEGTSPAPEMDLIPALVPQSGLGNRAFAPAQREVPERQRMEALQQSRLYTRDPGVSSMRNHLIDLYEGNIASSPPEGYVGNLYPQVLPRVPDEVLPSSATLPNYSAAATSTGHDVVNNRARWALQGTTLQYALVYGHDEMVRRAQYSTEFSYQIHDVSFLFAGGQPTIGRLPWALLTKVNVPALGERIGSVLYMPEAFLAGLSAGLTTLGTYQVDGTSADSAFDRAYSQAMDQRHTLGARLINASIENLNPPGGGLNWWQKAARTYIDAYSWMATPLCD